VALETSAFIYILEKIEKGGYFLTVSEALVYENNKNPEEERKIRVATYFHLAKEFVKIDETDIERAKLLKGLGFPDIDALHIALAEKANVHYFVTCDDDILKLYKKNENAIRVKIASLIELIGLEE
jgi:predicted nucleic acid-binding protein